MDDKHTLAVKHNDLILMTTFKALPMDVLFYLLHSPPAFVRGFRWESALSIRKEGWPYAPKKLLRILGGVCSFFRQFLRSESYLKASLQYWCTPTTWARVYALSLPMDCYYLNRLWRQWQHVFQPLCYHCACAEQSVKRYSPNTGLEEEEEFCSLRHYEMSVKVVTVRGHCRICEDCLKELFKQDRVSRLIFM